MLDDDLWKAVTTVGYLAHPETLKHRPCRSHAVNVTMPRKHKSSVRTAIKTGTPRACNGAVSDQVGTNIHNHTEMPRTNCLLSPLKNTLRPIFASSVSR